ncbi:MAG: hypothetical protein WC144_02445 [Sulfurimonas sp.]
MNLEDFKNTKVLLFGKTRAFSKDEFLTQLKHLNIELVDELSEDVLLVIEGAMMSPRDELKLDEVYAKVKDKLTNIDSFEDALAKTIEPNTLLMSLKLSRDKQRLKSFLQNKALSDEVFFKLIDMYEWGGDDFFENDSNRDVSAAIIVRFYKNIEQNHNVQYATTGLVHLLSQCEDKRVLELIWSLKPTKKASNKTLQHIIALHPKTPKHIVFELLKLDNQEVLDAIATKDELDDELQERLISLAPLALSTNKNLTHKTIKELMSGEIQAKNIAKNILLDDEIFELLMPKYSEFLAQNISLSLDMQRRLLGLCDDILATNKNLHKEVFLELKSELLYTNPSAPKDLLLEAFKDSKNHLALSKNPTTPSDILHQIYELSDIKIQEALALNPATPIEVLYQLQLDSRLDRLVKQNITFATHIKTQDMGWI